MFNISRKRTLMLEALTNVWSGKGYFSAKEVLDELEVIAEIKGKKEVN